MKLDQARPGRRRRVPGRGGAVTAVAFVAASVVALAVVPLVMGRRAAEAQREVVEILDPARLLGTRLSLVQARQMSLFQAFLLAGDVRFERPYQATLAEEQLIYDELGELVQGMSLDVRGRLADLSTLSSRWHVGHQAAFESEEARTEVLASLEEEQRRYDELQRATLALDRSIQLETEAGVAQMTRMRSLQTRITLGLVALALVATLATGIIGWRLRTLTAETQARREDAVRARRAYEALLEATSDGVLGIDLDGRCISLNRAGSELLGYPEHDLVGRDVHDTLHHTEPDGTPRDREVSPITRALSGGVMAHSTDQDVLWRRDGTRLPVLWTLRPLVDGLEVRGGVLTFADMTQIREKEEALRRAVRAREEVVSVVSHDLRNPLGVVAGAADLLLDLPLDEPERRKQATVIKRSARRMGRLVRDLLDVSRIEAGALVVRPTAEEAAGILDETRDIFAAQAEEAGISLEVAPGPGTAPLFADRDRIQQAMVNLVTNALKFTPAGGRVVLSARARGSDRVVLTVQDDGPGLVPEAMEHLFDRFWQANRDDRTGSGLGLAIVRGIVEAHGGSVEVRSRPGEGAAFSMVLPVATDEPAEDDAEGTEAE